MTTNEENCLARLEREGRLLNPVVHAASAEVPGRYVFRGDLAVKLAATKEREKRPPALKVEQVMLAAVGGKLSFFAAYLLSFESLAPLVEVLDGMLAPEGRYFAFCNNIELGTSYQVPFGESTFYVFPLDESSVFNELLDLFKLDKTGLKKLSSVGKVDVIASAAKSFAKTYERIPYARGLELMGPVKDPGENRPV